MSTRAITWAMERQGLKSSTKFVLVALANYANEQHEAYPSVAALESDTCQDRKTVLANLRRLVDGGFLMDSGKRVGSTAQVVVYRLAVGVDVNAVKSTENGTVTSAAARTNAGVVDSRGAVESLQTVPKTEPFNSAENGTVTAERVPNSGLLNSTVFPPKESQFSAETVPFLGHVYVKEPLGTKEPPKAPQGGRRVAASDRGERLPDGWGFDADGPGGMTVEVVEAARALKTELAVDWGLARLRFELGEFSDYWRSATGRTSKKLDWLAAWRNRLRQRMAEAPGNDPVRRDRQLAAARDAARMGA